MLSKYNLFTTIAIYYIKEILIDVINRIKLYLMLLHIIYFLHISFSYFMSIVNENFYEKIKN